MQPHWTRFAAVALLALVPACAGPGAGATGPATLTLTDGTVLSGEVVDSDAGGLMFQVADEEEPRRLVRARLEPASWLVTRSARPDLTVDDRLGLVHAALDAGLYEVAEVEAAKALELDPSAEEDVLAAWRDGCAAYAQVLADEAEQAFGDGDRRLAERQAARVLTLFPETPAAAAAEDVVERLHADIGQPEWTGVELVASADADRRLRQAEQYVGRAQKRNLAGLQRSGSDARRSFEGAAADYQKAIQLLDQIAGNSQADPPDRLAARELRDEAVLAAVDVHINLANFMMNRGSYPQAGEAIDEALALAPDNARALAHKNRIATVAGEAERVRKLSRKLGKKLRYG